MGPLSDLSRAERLGYRLCPPRPRRQDRRFCRGSARAPPRWRAVPARPDPVQPPGPAGPRGRVSATGEGVSLVTPLARRNSHAAMLATRPRDRLRRISRNPQNIPPCFLVTLPAIERVSPAVPVLSFLAQAGAVRVASSPSPVPGAILSWSGGRRKRIGKLENRADVAIPRRRTLPIQDVAPRRRKPCFRCATMIPFPQERSNTGGYFTSGSRTTSVWYVAPSSRNTR